MLPNNVKIADLEVFSHDWVFVSKDCKEDRYTVIHNDSDALLEWVSEEDSIFVFFNGKHYDVHIVRAICAGLSPEEVKQVNDWIICGGQGWDCPLLDGAFLKMKHIDLMDDMQVGLSLKAIEAHLGMDIRESEVDFSLDRPLTRSELEQTIFYCKHDVDATEKLYHLRKGYLENKLTLGRAKDIDDSKALYMTNAKLTAAYLDAKPTEYDDERQYVLPTNLLREYIAPEVFDFFGKLHDQSLSDEEVFSRKMSFNIGDCHVTLGFGGIHGAIPCYRERATEGRSIRNLDVASYYPHLMVIDGYCSRSIPNPGVYKAMLESRMRAKKAGDKATANALKLVANTTYGAMLNRYNPLYDPLMGHSVCITGQLRLLELANHLVADCPSLKIVQLNTDGIMVSLDDSDLCNYDKIHREWQERTGFELEEDCIAEIIQKDVNGYVEVQLDGKVKTKGGYLVRGIAPAGAFNINNNATIVPKALVEYFVHGTPVEDTINACNDMSCFMLIAKASSKYTACWHEVDGVKERVQKCNRVYATTDKRYGTLYKTHAESGTDAKIAGLPTHCVIDNNNELGIGVVDKEWYIALAKQQVNDFLGIKPPKKNTRKINQIKKSILNLLEVEIDGNQDGCSHPECVAEAPRSES